MKTTNQRPAKKARQAKPSSASNGVSTTSLIIQDHFTKQAKPLRQFFEAQFADPHSLQSKRFVWDFWNIRDQYRLLRTPAYHYFPESTYMALHKELVMWGRRHLGCWDISPPWLSCYIDNCYQDMHSDVPHGPWAFVLSISPDQPRFRGGQTWILKDTALNFWRQSARNEDRELKSFVDLVEPRFNRLVVFDPRVPHGVRRVEGAEEPTEGRLVIHGWFSQPKTYVEGTLHQARHTKTVEKLLNQALDRVLTDLDVPQGLWGTLAIGLTVSRTGRVTRSTFRTCTLRDGDGQIPVQLLNDILNVYGEIRFPASEGQTEITLPLIFEP